MLLKINSIKPTVNPDTTLTNPPSPRPQSPAKGGRYEIPKGLRYRHLWVSSEFDLAKTFRTRQIQDIPIKLILQ